MRIVVIGAYGLLGGFVTARLLREGHQIIGVGREVRAATRRFPAVRWASLDLRDATSADWRALLTDADALVNCAGALQDSARDNLQLVHVDAVSTLADACAAAGVRRLVHISAVGVERGVGAFGRTKSAADEALRSSDLDWVILRPGLVLAPAAFGGSALLRALAAFPPFIPALDPGATIQIVSVEDVAEAVSRSVLPSAPARFTCDLVAAEQTALADILIALRRWLGLAPAPVIAVPAWVGRAAASAADALAWLGWRSPLRTASIEQLAAGVLGRTQDAPERLGFTPLSLDETLAQWPSGVQERWFARLYLFKPLALATLAAFWGVSGIIGLANHAAATRLLTGAALPHPLAADLVLAGALADIVIAALVAFRNTAPLALKAMIAVTAAYLLGATLWLPQLWTDPLGPLVKSVPAAVLALGVLAIMDER